MPRPKRKIEFPFDGLLVIDKPSGITSADVVDQVKWATKPGRIGHTGTLDPMATGVLVLCLNQATKLAGYVADHDKVYQGVILLGVATDTYDVTGRVLRREPVKLDPEDVIVAAQKFQGVITQRPPAFSALKQGGEALYKKARRGEEVTVEPREVTIHSFELTEINLPRVTFEIRCSKGTYIRSLAHDLGAALGCGGTLEELRRTAVGPFTLDEALTLGMVDSLTRQRRLKTRLIGLAKALPDWPAVVLPPEAAERISHGQKLADEELTGLDPRLKNKGQRIRLINQTGDLIALAHLASSGDGTGLDARPIRVFAN